MKERTFVALKPDAVKRKLIGRIIQRFEDKGLDIVDMKMLTLSREMVEKCYMEHRGKGFYEKLINFMTSGRIVILIVEGENVISIVRKMIGSTNPKEAEPGTIRGDFALSTPDNIIHASDSKESAEREISLFFGR
ncbi:MAG: nucleoside-diphosphate kinase [Methanothermococcus sp.]|jgi:nucleoside-diphosphate kinase|uniref:nucleoside-diphosphate kinase n=1 Tax=Methanothermococcus TaxID=155862 RepID=UPI00037AD6E2|nr:MULTISPECIES: nucleoside-diphosphate kinase [Methanothermococcus]MDK2790036.1 nucleoside-diphosphate kinase [Methanothermococcus sp.]MDK2987086.1 nucleoside-diphosphate kinase [Methanothermococcus sp.]